MHILNLTDFFHFFFNSLYINSVHNCTKKFSYNSYYSGKLLKGNFQLDYVLLHYILYFYIICFLIDQNIFYEIKDMEKRINFLEVWWRILHRNLAVHMKIALPLCKWNQLNHLSFSRFHLHKFSFISCFFHHIICLIQNNFFIN